MHPNGTTGRSIPLSSFKAVSQAIVNDFGGPIGKSDGGEDIDLEERGSGSDSHNEG